MARVEVARWKRVTLVCRAWCTAWGKSKQQGVKGGEIAFPLCAINVSLALWPWCSAITTTIALWHRYIKRLNLKQPPILAPKSPEWPPLSFFSSSRHVLMSAMTKGTRMSPMLPTSWLKWSTITEGVEGCPEFLSRGRHFEARKFERGMLNWLD